MMWSGIEDCKSFHRGQGQRGRSWYWKKLLLLMLDRWAEREGLKWRSYRGRRGAKLDEELGSFESEQQNKTFRVSLETFSSLLLPSVLKEPTTDLTGELRA
ncbi:hypothetical protein ACFX13_029356 [Malus domestica]